MAEACHTLIDPGVAGREVGDGEGVLSELHARRGVPVQEEASEAPGDGRRRRTYRAEQTERRAGTLNHRAGLRQEGGIVD